MVQPLIGIERIFVIDTSALIDMKRWYPREAFPELWEKIERMVNDGEIIAPQEVLYEIERGDDELKEWCKENAKMFVDVDYQMIEVFNKVRDKYDKKEWEKHSEEEYWADPWVISLAVSTEIIKDVGKEHPVIVTSENQVKPNKIPTIAREFGIESINVPQFMKEILGGGNG
ncbi:DUF4411 family protein (plasmid) [Campylobacterota bacterium DY0563]